LEGRRGVGFHGWRGADMSSGERKLVVMVEVEEVVVVEEE
jgi:hypothetical protein